MNDLTNVTVTGEHSLLDSQTLVRGRDGHRSFDNPGQGDRYRGDIMIGSLPGGMGSIFLENSAQLLAELDR